MNTPNNQPNPPQQPEFSQNRINQAVDRLARADMTGDAYSSSIFDMYARVAHLVIAGAGVASMIIGVLWFLFQAIGTLIQ